MDDDKYRIKLVKNMQMLATLVATATYAAAFNPPGGVWQDIHDATGQHLPGDPIMRSTNHGRYVVFFYCNAAAFALSLAVVVLTLLLITPHNKAGSCLIKKHRSLPVILMIFTLLSMLALAAAYGAGICRHKVTVAWYCLLVLGPLALFINHIIVLRKGDDDVQAAVIDKEAYQVSEEDKEDFHKLMVPVSMFALTITYVAGLSTPGGFWDSAEDGHRPGDPILKDRLHGRVLRGFLLANTFAFAASMYSVSIVMRKRTRVAGFLFEKRRKVVIAGFLARFNFMIVGFGLLCGLLVAYIIASSRGRRTTAWLTEAALGCIVVYVAVYVILNILIGKAIQRYCSKIVEAIQTQITQWKAVASKVPCLSRKDEVSTSSTEDIPAREEASKEGVSTSSTEDNVPADETEKEKKRRRQLKFVQLMASLAVAITYQAGLYPPGGLWPSNTDGQTAGDPILLTTNSTRYRGFHYSNSLSFVASLLAMLLAQIEHSSLHEHRALEAAMLLDMLGLIGAYAIGSCRDQLSTLYVVGIAGAVVVYVFVHVSYFTLGDADKKEEKDDENVEKMRSRFLIFAILVASMTYQAGLTPPGGFLLKDDAQSGHLAGDPVLRYNYPRRYWAFFYCNSVSFMVSIVIILLLINPIEYKPAIRSHALSVCSVASYVGLMGAFSAGSTQHMKGSIYFLVLAAVVTFFFCLAIPLWLWRRPDDDTSNSNSNMGDGGNPTNTFLSQQIGTSQPAPASRTRCRCCISNETNRRATLGEDEETKDIEKMEPGGGKEEEARTTTRSEKKNKEGEWKRNTKSDVSLVTLAILVASATYPAGLDPPGGSWQSSSDGHDAGMPMMLDNRRPRYIAFFFSNTTSFMASIILIHMLLPAMLPQTEEFHESYRRKGLKGLVALQCLGFLVAYAAGSSRRWKTSVYTGSALVIFVLTFFFIHILLSMCLRKRKKDSTAQRQRCLHPCDHCKLRRSG